MFCRLLDTVFEFILTREQRERHSRSKWEKSVARSAFEIGLASRAAASLGGSSTPTQVAQQESPQTPTAAAAATTTAPAPSSNPMTPSLSSSSSSTSDSSNSSSGMNSPITRSRPSTSYSTSPTRPIYYRHTSITRAPISYDFLISQHTTNSSAKEKEAHKKPSRPAPLLYPLPPLGPMEGVGKYRRSIHVSEDFMDALHKNNIAALQPLLDEPEKELPAQPQNSPTTPAGFQDFSSRAGGRSLWRRGSSGNRDTTTPPRGYSTSPPATHSDEEGLHTQRADGRMLAYSTRRSKRSSTVPPPIHRRQFIVEEVVVEVDVEADADDNDYEDVPDNAVVFRRPVRTMTTQVARKRTQNRIGGGGGGATGLAAPMKGRGRQGSGRGRGGNRAPPAPKVTAKKNGVPDMKSALIMSASMETLVSGEE